MTPILDALAYIVIVVVFAAMVAGLRLFVWTLATADDALISAALAALGVTVEDHLGDGGMVVPDPRPASVARARDGRGRYSRPVGGGDAA